MSEIACCGRWKNCATEGRCISQSFTDTCAYANHLANGFNFLNSDFKDGPYLAISDRLFYIGHKGHVGSRRINSDDGATLSALGFRLTSFCLVNARVEFATAENPCSFRVVTKVQDAEYVILNANVRMIQQSTALKVRDYLRDAGLPARIEQIGVSSKHPPLSQVPEEPTQLAPSIPMTKPNANLVPLLSACQAAGSENKQPPKTLKIDPTLPLPGQISLFDLI